MYLLSIMFRFKIKPLGLSIVFLTFMCACNIFLWKFQFWDIIVARNWCERKAYAENLIEVNNRFYYISAKDDLRTWEEARAFCKTKDLDLASIESEEENQALFYTIKQKYGTVERGSDDHKLWLGGTDEHKEGNWSWVSSGQSISTKYSHYHVGGVDAGRRENCLVTCATYVTLDWCDAPCSRHFNFICKLDHVCFVDYDS